MVRRAAQFIIREGPLTTLDRWEDAGGLSPSTLAACIAALIVASEFANDAGEHIAAGHFRTGILLGAATGEALASWIATGERPPNIAFLGLFAFLYWLHRNQRRFGGGEGYALDPTCGMQVRTVDAPASRHRDGTSYWFCSDGCAERFDRESATHTREN